MWYLKENWPQPRPLTHGVPPLSILVSVNTVGRHPFMRTPIDYTFNLYLHPCKQLQHRPSLWPRYAHTRGEGCPWMNRPMEEFLPDPESPFGATRTGNVGVLWIWIMAYKRWCRPWKGIYLWPSEIPPPLEIHGAEGGEDALKQETHRSILLTQG